ncbi:MAG: serine protease [Gallionella sp.]|nr:serine protease [Gallionella sp.]MDD4959455.1 serine protease [Gallionella sp.]
MKNIFLIWTWQTMMILWMGCLALPVYAAPQLATSPLPPPAEPVRHDGKAVFAVVKDSVVQIRTLLKGSKSQNSTGSGFYVGDDGLLITNYHVVSSHALEPETYELEYVASNEEHGTLTLLAIDVLHDLALLQRKGSNLPYLHFHVGTVEKGDNLFSLGNPNDLGQSIVEGTNNGLRDHSFYDMIHFTGAINAGMSGGPVVTEAGEVYGINDASMGESRGFLVPAQYASQLLARWRANPIRVPQFRPEIARQLKLHSAALVARLTRKPMPVQMDGGYAIPDSPDPFIRCWARERNREKLLYTVRSYSCNGRSEVFVENGIDLGSLFFYSSLFNADKLDPVRFSRVLERSYEMQYEASYEIPSEHFSKYACNDAIVQIKGNKVKAAICLRSYRKFPGLYDIKFKIVTLRQDKRALVSSLSLNGFAYDDGMRMIEFYMGAFK